ncbi:MAG: hypothetical protein R2771_00810 [Saprospiraceae bacterium]
MYNDELLIPKGDPYSILGFIIGEDNELQKFVIFDSLNNYLEYIGQKGDKMYMSVTHVEDTLVKSFSIFSR